MGEMGAIGGWWIISVTLIFIGFLLASSHGEKIVEKIGGGLGALWSTSQSRLLWAWGITAGGTFLAASRIYLLQQKLNSDTGGLGCERTASFTCNDWLFHPSFITAPILSIDWGFLLLFGAGLILWGGISIGRDPSAKWVKSVLQITTIGGLIFSISMLIVNIWALITIGMTPSAYGIAALLGFSISTYLTRPISAHHASNNWGK